MHKHLDTHKANGYLPSTGQNEARAAIATYSSRPGFGVDKDDVIIASGCSGAVELVISALINEGENILVPSPGFPLYQVITDSLGGHTKKYNLLPDKAWECDLEQMDSLIDSGTRAILVNNPSNPCGAVYSAQHLKDIAAVARKHNLPIIADEIYSGIVFDGEKFEAMNVHSGDVPVLSMGGLAKEFVCPGWRVGWVVVHDRNNRLTEVKTGLNQLTQLIVGANSLVQACIPDVLTPADKSKEHSSLNAYAEKYIDLLQNNSKAAVVKTKDCPELEVIPAQGAMYAMVRVNVDALTGIKDDTDFAQQLLQEENLVVLPGACFGIENFVRILTCPPKEVVDESIERMNDFCAKRRKDGGGRKRSRSAGNDAEAR
jgi:tyrosine aminotransferase